MPSDSVQDSGRQDRPRTLVTGGAGFLGSHVADALSEAGHDVTIFDAVESPYLRPDQRMATGDILDAELVGSIAQDMDYVYHFAGIADIDECETKPSQVAEINILGTVRLLEACTRIKRFVFASSAYVYSAAGSFYRSSKQACELFIEDFHEQRGLPYTILRYGSLYGTRADERNSIHRLLRQALRDKCISYRGTGEEVREYIHVEDAARISVQILDAAFENERVMLTGTEKMRYVELLHMVREMLHGDVAIDMQPSNRKAHYTLTPYNFSPKPGKKLTANPHIDMGQGLLQCMAEIYENLLKENGGS
ncbi:NAD-dependent epimerase/dehydratase family protein [Oceanidesulfovibrio marinus]|uniref:NAD-dependent epimerase/dehydratase family protein n=1 Tax=Oceanidesulfovibrio marinus TaxID=370038 RepID=UPI001F20A24B|nr:NAD(P)-dependent oxidoreductase [Oceanidesulfovibrio marinus]